MSRKLRPTSPQGRVAVRAGIGLLLAAGGRLPAKWPRGFTGRHSGSEVEVLGRHGDVGRRVAALLLAVAVAIAVAGCISGPPVPLLTGRGGLPPLEPGMVGCYTDFASGPLTVDTNYGTAITDMGHTTPVMWPPGYTGRQAGSEVEVIDETGKVRARTGNRYQIEGGYGSREPLAFVACGYVLPK